MPLRRRWVGFTSSAGLVLAGSVLACGRAGPAIAPVPAASTSAPLPLPAAAAPSASVASPPTAAPAMPGKNVPAIKVDTVGYPLDWRKLAIH